MPKKNLPDPPDYEEGYKVALKKNVKEIASLVNNNDEGMIFKIKSFCEKFDQDYDIIRQKILDDKIFAVFFAIDPKTQKFHEKLAAKYIQSLPFVNDFKDSSTNEKFVSKGGVYAKKDIEKSGGESSAKSIDFIWTYNNLTFYAYHKYTKQSGGSQGSQYKDLRSFLKEANSSNDQKAYFIAIADGAFYSTKASRSSTKTKLEKLKEEANPNKRVYAMSIDELAEFLIDICENYAGE